MIVIFFFGGLPEEDRNKKKGKKMVETGMLIAVGCVLLGVGFLLLMLCGPTDSRHGPIGRAYAWLVDDFPQLASRCLRLVCGPKIAAYIEQTGDWTFNKPNPLLQIFYVSLVLGAIIIFYLSVWPYVLQARYVSPIHVLTVPLILFLMFGLYYAACKSDPGIVTAANVTNLLDVYSYDHVIFAPQVCSTCLQAKPARSKHCSWCGRCIARFDHHCVWINGCVGANNTRFFIGWLLTMVAVCCYGQFLIWRITVGIVADKRLFSLQVVDPETRQRVPVTLYHVVLYMLGTENLMMVLGLFLALVSLLLIAFVGHHLYLIAVGTTTNELFKWDEARHKLKQNHTFIVPPAEDDTASSSSSKRATSRLASTTKRNQKSSVSSSSSSSSSQGTTITEPSQLHNIYNHGVIKNFVEVFFPPKFF